MEMAVGLAVGLPSESVGASEGEAIDFGGLGGGEAVVATYFGAFVLVELADKQLDVGARDAEVGEGDREPE